MTHNAVCEYAKGDLCRCECEGEFHGIKDHEDDPLIEIPEEEIVLKIVDPQKTILGFAKGKKMKGNGIQAKCPNCGLVVDVAVNLLNQLWDEGSQLTLKCKNCDTFFRGEW